MTNKKIVLITTGQPSVNPRVVKEADALQAAGFDVTVLYSFFIQWAKEKDDVLLKNVAWSFKMIGGGQTQNKNTYLFTRLRCKLNNILSKYAGNKFLIAEKAQARAYNELLHAAKKIKADWYIGHNLGALAIAAKAAKHNTAKAGFDFEDYYRGEGHDEKTIERIVFLENKYIPSLSYYSTASDFITRETKLSHPHFNIPVITLLNCFPLTQQPNFKEKNINDNTLNLFWFSQTIGLNRGLEILIKALKVINNSSIHLTLAGRCNTDFTDYLKLNYAEILSNIHFAGIIPPNDLPTFASQFDVGMALEINEPFNRDICLTNKVFTYLLAGNAIILSNTSMQHAFNNEHKIGVSFAVGDVNELVEKINFYLNKENFSQQKKCNYDLAKNIFNWENESKKLLAIIH